MNWTEPTYNGDYPVWARAIGWMMILSSLIWIPVIWIFEFIRSPGSIVEVSFQHTEGDYIPNKEGVCAMSVIFSPWNYLKQPL